MDRVKWNAVDVWHARNDLEVGGKRDRYDRNSIYICKPKGPNPRQLVRLIDFLPSS